MTREAILDLFQTQLSEWLGREVMLRESDRIDEDLNLDSLDKIEFWMYIEDTFKISIPEEQMNKCQTIRDIVDIIVKKGV